jgi:dihydrofolate synthase/folylpolyglutamate synthase
MNFRDAEIFLDRLQMFGIKLGLDQVSELFELLGRPQEKLKFIHIAGSNGKGSVGAFLVAAFRAVGIKTGFYSSPHLVSVRERFRIDGKAVSEKEFCALMDKLKPCVDAMEKEGRCPTYFEATTALAALCFAENDVDVVIWETGMGGRFDATNIVDPLCSVITGISLEHQQYLGDTIEKISMEKAGIIKRGKPVFCGRMADECKAVVRSIATENEAEASFVEDAFNGKLGLFGDIQKYNASLAAKVLEFLSGPFGFDTATALKGFADAKWPGRLQMIDGKTIVDGAHNPDGAKILCEYLDEFHPNKNFDIIFGCFADKDPEAFLRKISEKAASFIFVPVWGGRACNSPGNLGKVLESFSAIPFSTAERISDALSKRSDNPILITGSLYLAGEALKQLLPENEILDI